MKKKRTKILAVIVWVYLAGFCLTMQLQHWYGFEPSTPQDPHITLSFPGPVWVQKTLYYFYYPCVALTDASINSKFYEMPDECKRMQEYRFNATWFRWAYTFGCMWPSEIDNNKAAAVTIVAIVLYVLVFPLVAMSAWLVVRVKHRPKKAQLQNG